MAVYSIDYSEPLKVGFEIPAGAFDGPGASVAASHTSLRLHGRGSLEWGEAVNENLVRLTENFASASPPSNILPGQMWVELKLYHHMGGNIFKRYNLATSAWEDLNGGAAIGTTVPSTPTRGMYYTSGNVLYGYYEIATVREPVMGWRPRSFSSGTLPTTPSQTVNMYNAFANSGAGAWVPPQSVTVSTADPSLTSTLTPGALWYDTTTGTLNVWDGAAWSTLVTSGAAATGGIDMVNLYTISNLPLPVLDGDAANKLYVDSTSVSITGDTMTGPLVLNADPATALGAATKQYVDNAVSGATSGNTSGVHMNPVGTFTYMGGDIAIAGGKIYIALTGGTTTCPGGSWKQVWPATYA